MTWKRKGFKPIDEYPPESRGMVSIATAPEKATGKRYLRDGDFSERECPCCFVALRVRKPRKGYPELWCPCGHTEPAK